MKSVVITTLLKTNRKFRKTKLFEILKYTTTTKTPQVLPSIIKMTNSQLANCVFMQVKTCWNIVFLMFAGGYIYIIQQSYNYRMPHSYSISFINLKLQLIIKLTISLKFIRWFFRPNLNITNLKPYHKSNILINILLRF